MRVFLSAFILALAVTLSGPAVAESAAAPFGLQWGMDVADLGALDINIESTTRSGNLTVVNVRETPQSFDDTYLVNLLFAKDYGLVKVRWMSNDIENDITGKQGRQIFRGIKGSLAASYGEPTDEAQVIGARLYDQDDEFYQCLAYRGCGVWSAIWEQKPSGGILLSIEGLGAGKGFVQLDFESEGWRAAIEAYE